MYLYQESVVVRLWTRNGIMSAADARRLVVTLSQRALLRAEPQGDSRRIALHDLQHDLLRALYPETQPLHAELVKTYQEECGKNWTKLQDDGYCFHYIVLHLLLAGEKGDAIQLVTGSDAWFRYKRFRPEYQTGLQKDLDWCLLAKPSSLEVAQLCAVRQLLRYGATAYSDTDLKSLVLLGRKEEALNQARLRTENIKIIEGLLAVCEAGVDLDVHGEIESGIRALPQPYDRGRLIAKFACLLADTQEPKAKALAIEALRVPPAVPETTSWSDYTRTLFSAFSALLRTGLTREALRFINAVEDDGWRTYFLRRLGVAAAEGNAKSAKTCLNSVITRIRRSKATVVKTLALAEIAATLARGGDKTRARRLLREAERGLASAQQVERVRVLVRAAEAHALLGTGEAPRLFRIAEQEIQGGKIRNLPRGDLFGYLTEALIACGRFEDARRVANHESVRELVRGRILEHLVGELTRRDRIGEAAQEAKAIESMEGRAGAFSKIALGLVRLGNRNDGAEYLRQAIETRQSYDARSRTLDALARLAEALLPQERKSANAILDSAIQAARELPRDYDYSSSVKEVARCCCRAGRLADAESLLDFISNEVLVKEAAATLAEALGAAGKVDAAVALAASRLDDDALFTCAAGIHERAGRWVKALDAARSIGSDYDRIVKLAEIGKSMALAREPQAPLVFQEARSLVETARDECIDDTAYLRQIALAAIVHALVSCSWLEDAWTTAESIETGLEGTKAKLNVAAALARTGDRRGIEFMSLIWQACAAQEKREPIVMLAWALAEGGFAEDTLSAVQPLLNAPDLDQPDRFDICRSLANAGLMAAAIQNLRDDSLDRYLEELAVMSLEMEKHHAGTTAPLLKESVRIAGWVRSDWERIHSMLS